MPLKPIFSCRKVATESSLHTYCRNIIGILQLYHISITSIFHAYHRYVAGILPVYYKYITGILQVYFRYITACNIPVIYCNLQVYRRYILSITDYCDDTILMPIQLSSVYHNTNLHIVDPA